MKTRQWRVFRGVGRIIWFFERSGERIQCEIRPTEDANAFELVWTFPDGRIDVERSDDVAQLTERRNAQEKRLRIDGWTTSAA